MDFAELLHVLWKTGAPAEFVTRQDFTPVVGTIHYLSKNSVYIIEQSSGNRVIVSMMDLAVKPL